MKKLQTIQMFAKTGLVAAAFFLTACSGDDGDNNGNPGGSGNAGSFIEGEVDGVQFNNLEIQGQSLAVATTSGTGAGRLIMVTGSDTNTNAMSVIMLGITQTGEYTINSEDDGTVLAYIPVDSPSYDTSNCAGATGTLNITHIDETKVEGTFNFVGKVDENCGQSKTITSGSFRGVFLTN